MRGLLRTRPALPSWDWLRWPWRLTPNLIVEWLIGSRGMGLAESATIRSVTLVECQADDFASGGEAIVVLNAAKHGQADQIAARRWLLDQLGIGVGYGMCRLRGARAVVVFGEFPDDPSNVGGIEKDEVIERVFA